MKNHEKSWKTRFWQCQQLIRGLLLILLFKRTRLLVLNSHDPELYEVYEERRHRLRILAIKIAAGLTFSISIFYLFGLLFHKLTDFIVQGQNFRKYTSPLLNY